MPPPKIIKFRDFKRLLRKFGIKVVRGSRHNYHFLSPDGVRYPVPFTRESEDVERPYVNAARRAFNLTPRHGVSHKQFYGRQ